MEDTKNSDAPESTDPSAESRRSLLKRGAAAAAAVAVAGVAGAKSAEAANGNPLLIGSSNSGTATTSLVGGSTLNVDNGNSVLFLDQHPVSILGVQDGDDGVGVAGSASGESGVGVYGISEGLTGVPLFLAEAPEALAVPPTTGSWFKGSFLVKNGALWYCYSATDAGANSRWVRLSSTLIMVSPPKRAYDSRFVGGGPGPILGGQTKVIDLTAAGVPDNSSAALLSVQLINTTGAGFLSLYSAAVATHVPGFSTMQWSSSGQRLANEVTVAVSSTGQIKVYGGGKTDFFIDVVGFLP